RNAPKPTPSTTAAVSTPGQVCHEASISDATATTTPDQTTKTLRRPIRSDHRPAITAETATTTEYSAITTNSASSGFATPTASPRKYSRYRVAMALPRLTTNRVSQAQAKSGWRRGETQNDRANAATSKAGRSASGAS